MLKVLKRVFNVLYPDRRPDWEQRRERELEVASTTENPIFSVRMPAEREPLTIRDMVRYLVLTPIQHCMTVHLEGPILEEPAHGVHELPMRKHNDVIGRLLR